MVVGSDDELGMNDICDDGYDLVLGDPQDGGDTVDPVDLNKGAGGKYIYLCVQHSDKSYEYDGYAASAAAS